MIATILQLTQQEVAGIETRIAELEKTMVSIQQLLVVVGCCWLFCCQLFVAVTFVSVYVCDQGVIIAVVILVRLYRKFSA